MAEHEEKEEHCKFEEPIRKKKTQIRIFYPEKRVVQLPTKQGERSRYLEKTKVISHREPDNDFMENVLSR